MNFVEKILVVDCIPSELDLFSGLLASRNRSVVHVVSDCGQIGNAEDIGDFSLLLIDLRPSVEKGIKAAKALAVNGKKSPPLVFIIQPECPEERVIADFRSSLVDFIVEPVKPELLRNKAEAFLMFNRNLREIKRRNSLLKRQLATSRDELDKLKNAVEHCAEKVIVTNLEGRIEYINPAFLELTGYTKREVIGRKTSLLKSGRHDVEYYRSMWKTVLGGMVWQGEIINKKKDGELSCEQMTISPVRGSSGISGFVAVQYDVSREKAFYERMVQTEKLSAIGTFVSGMAHEINNPLTAIMGYSDLLLRKKGVPDDIISELGIILDQARRSSSLVKNLLDFSRRSRASRMLLDIGSIVGDSIGLYFTRFRLDGIQIETDYGDCKMYVYGDKNRLQQVFVNIINNGHYALTSAKSSGVAIFRVQTRVSCKTVKVVFENNGPHIPEKSLGRIFEPFFTSKDMEHGTGLGLSVSAEILKEQGGTITVKNLESGSDENWKTGVRFEIELPLNNRDDA